MEKKKITPKKIEKNTIIGEVLKMNKDAENILLGFGMHCLYCPMAQMETIEEACEVHDLDLEEVLIRLNEPQTKKTK